MEETNIKLFFTCQDLHQTDCSTEEDVVKLHQGQLLPLKYLILNKSHNPHRPTTGLFIETSNTTYLNTGMPCFSMLTVLKKFSYTGHFFHTASDQVEAKVSNDFEVHLKTPFPENKGPETYIYALNVSTPREAKCVTSWFDDQILPDEKKELSITKIIRVRNMHGVMSSLKMNSCIVCERKTPGLPIKNDDMKVLEIGQKLR